MDASTDYCELCDLPRSQCVHGQPPPRPTKAAKPTPRPARRSTTSPRSTPSRPVVRRWTPPEVFKPLIVTVLEQADGGLEAQDVLRELELLAGDRLVPGDHEPTPAGELRWHYAARRARAALVEEGVMTKSTPGLWQLS